MQKSKRNKNLGRTAKTFNNKLVKLTVKYNRLFKQSQKSKEVFNKLEEMKQKTILKQRSQQRKTPKEFFCDKYVNLEKFLKVNKLRKVSNKWNSN